jgi:hypothetical protein
MEHYSPPYIYFGYVDAWIPKQSVLDFLLRDLATFGTVTLGMYVAGGPIDEDTVLADLIEASYPGYSPVVFTPPYSGNTSLTGQTSEVDGLVFTGPSDSIAVSIAGFFATYQIMGLKYLLSAGDADPLVPINLLSDSDSVFVLYNFTELDCIHG